MLEATIDLKPIIRGIMEEEIAQKLAPQNEQARTTPVSARDESEYLSIDELSRMTGLKRSTIYAKRSRREMPAYKFGRELRFRRDEIDAWMQSKQLFCITEDKGDDRR